MDKQRVLEKVAKCFALANSNGASPNEVENQRFAKPET